MTTWKKWVGDHPNYYVLPPELAKLLAEYDLDGAELIEFDSARFDEILTEVLRTATESVQPFGPPAYHGGAHFNDVVSNVRTLLAANDEQVPVAVQQALLFAAATHDYAHQGATFRKDAVNGLPLPELGTDIATEQVSAILADELAERFGFSPAARMFIARSIHATTFGNPSISPQSVLEKLLAAADVGPNDTFEDWLRKGVAVTFGEKPAKPAPTTLSGWLGNRMGFVDYYLANFVTEGKPQFVAAAVKLGWNDMLASHRAKLLSLKDGTAEPALTEIVKAMLPTSVDLAA
ncbi:MAG: hypothetical protein EXS55_03375 [Candidatus Magasanikbacteria bacterium]|nr:hypothetical protein [Candidatus Magasanikbacteria bacterium]